MAGLYCGFDNDPLDILSGRSISFARARFPSRWWIAQRTPETQLWKRLEREGRLLGEASETILSAP